jgi:sodium/hydrogen antiporter
MSFETWFLALGGLLIVVALIGARVRHLPFTTTLIYLLVGVGIGPVGLGLVRLDPVADAALLHRVSEVAVLISLFTAGLKFRVRVRDPLWRIPLRLASVGMVLTVGLVAAVGVLVLDLPLGAAVLLGGILAPTDPVLASDVQLSHPGDRHRLRFSLTGEAGLNDGTAFPFVMLGLGLLGAESWGGVDLARWLAVDLVWAVAAGLAIGFLLGSAVGHVVLHLRREHKEAFGLDDFLALGLIGVAYGAAHLAHSYGFLAVFAAGLALRRVERKASPPDAEPTELAAAAAAGAGKSEEIATDPEKAPAYMAQAVLGFNEQLERLCEVGVVLLVGILLSGVGLSAIASTALLVTGLLLFLLRPLAAGLALAGSDLRGPERRLAAWFGIRGIGSLYYLAFAIEEGLPEAVARPIAVVTLTAIAVSILLHGISVTPLLRRFDSRDDSEGGGEMAE